MSKKKHIVVPRTERALREGVTTSKGKLKFNGRQMIAVDEDIANEIEKTDGLKGTQDVWTHEDPRRNWSERYKADGIHSFFFGSSPRYSDAWDEFIRRRKIANRKRKKRAVDGGGNL